MSGLFFAFVVAIGLGLLYSVCPPFAFGLFAFMVLNGLVTIIEQKGQK